MVPQEVTVACDLQWFQAWIWCTDPTYSQTDEKHDLEAPWWTKLNTAGQMEINYKLCRRLWKSTSALSHELGWRQSNVRSAQVTLWLWCSFFTQYRVRNSKHLQQWMKLMDDSDLLIDPVLNTLCQYKQIKLFKQKNSSFCSKHKHSHVHLNKIS